MDCVSLLLVPPCGGYVKCICTRGTGKKVDTEVNEWKKQACQSTAGLIYTTACMDKGRQSGSKARLSSFISV